MKRGTPNRSRRGMLLAVSAGALLLAGLPGRSVMAAKDPTLARRSALVIGNAAYTDAPLRNPINDARLVSETLVEIGFDVYLLEDGSMGDMLGSLRRWLQTSANAEVRAFYFAGHGTQYKGGNYLVPVDMAIRAESEITRHAVALSSIVDTLSAQEKGVNFVFVDACRTDPSALLKNAPLTRGIDDPFRPGFQPTEAPRGTVVAYSTSPGSLAADGKAGRNSVFSQALATYLKEPGLPVETMFKRIRASVMRATRNTQVPWESSSLVGDFCFSPGEKGSCGYRR
ncbi:MAG: caspase family protein [Burkholderiaceae bacterium]